MQQDTKPAARPDTRDLLAHSHRAEQDGQSTRHVAVFLYPDCIREFDGASWSVRPLPDRGVAG